jgi:hypothetical protein
MKIIVFLTLLSLLLQKHVTVGTKHNFHIKTSKTLIGPVGIPFGYGAGGHFEIKVFEFELKVKKKGETSILDQVEAGFYLQKFENEAMFNQHIELLKSNTTLCSFDAFLDDKSKENFNYHDYEEYDDNFQYDDDTNDVFPGDDGMRREMNNDPLSQDDDEFENNGEILNAKLGIFLSMKSRKTWKPNVAQIEYTFKE